MISKRTVKKSIKGYKDWLKENPEASLGQRMLRSVQASTEAHELDISIKTLPSMVCPMPEPVGEDFERWVRKAQKRLKRK